MDFYITGSFCKGFYQGLKTFRYFAFFILLWILLGGFGVLPSILRENGNLIIQPILFIIGIPLSIIFRVDRLAQFIEGFGIGNVYFVFFIAGIISAINFGLIVGIKTVYRDFFQSKAGDVRPNKKHK